MSSPPRVARLRWVARLLLALFAAQALAASGDKTATFDEPAHIAAGMSYFKTGEIRINRQHPPLLKEIGALPLLALSAPWPVTREQWARIPDPPPPYVQWEIGYRILAAGGPARLLFWARLPFILLGTLMGWLIWTWGSRLAGPEAAVAALFLYVLDPSVMAHTTLVATDVGFAACGLLFVASLWWWLQHRTLRRLLACGAALGLMLGTKFSALLFLPVAGLLMLKAIDWIPAAVPRRASSLVDPYAAEGRFQRLVWMCLAACALAAVAATLLEAIYLLPSNPITPYLRGAALVNKDHDPSYWPYLAGTFAPRFLSYYVVAFLLKTPIGSLVLIGAGLWRLARADDVTRMDRLFLLLPPAVVLAAYTALSDNLGIRYLIPALPFLHLAGGIGCIGLWRGGGRVARIAAAAACLWVVVASAGIYPDHLSYFNEAACLLDDPAAIGLDGGSRCGPAWLDDSNVDWGQGVLQLKEWLAAHPSPGRLYLGYFGSMRPEDEGMTFERVGTKELAEPARPGRYAVSGHFLARTRGMLRQARAGGPAAWLLEARPSAVVGHAFYIFDVPG